MLRLFTIIVISSIFMLLLALASAYLIYRESQQRLKNLVHLETEHRLDLQEEFNKQHAKIRYRATVDLKNH